MTPVILNWLLAQFWTCVIATLLLTLPFWSSGLAKLADIPAALDEVRQLGLKPAWVVVSAMIMVQIGGSLLIVSGSAAWLGAGALAVFTGWATIIAHPFWNEAAAEARSRQRAIFFEHVGLIGGLMLAAIVSEISR